MLAEQATEFVGEGPTPDEIGRACVQLLRSEAQFHDATRQLMQRTGSWPQAGLPADFAERRIEALRATDPEWFKERLRALMSNTTLVTLTDSKELTG